MIAAATTLLAALFAALLFNQYATRRAPYQLAWAIGATAFAVAAGAEFAAQLIGWSEPLYRVWYLTGAVWTAGWLGAGTILLLAKTRFGYWYALCLALAGLFTILVARRLEDPSAGPIALAYALSAWGSRNDRMALVSCESALESHRNWIHGCGECACTSARCNRNAPRARVGG